MLINEFYQYEKKHLWSGFKKEVLLNEAFGDWFTLRLANPSTSSTFAFKNTLHSMKIWILKTIQWDSSSNHLLKSPGVQVLWSFLSSRYMQQQDCIYHKTQLFFSKANRLLKEKAYCLHTPRYCALQKNLRFNAYPIHRRFNLNLQLLGGMGHMHSLTECVLL